MREIVILEMGRNDAPCQHGKQELPDTFNGWVAEPAPEWFIELLKAFEEAVG